MTYVEFIGEIKSIIFPDREPSNLVQVHTKYILDGIIEVQKRVPQLRDRNFDSFTFGDTFYQCRATLIDPKPDGPLIRLYSYTQPDHCDRVYYQPVSREHMEALLRGCGTPATGPTGALVGPEPQDYLKALGDVVTPAPTAKANGNGNGTPEPIIGKISFTPNSLIGGTNSIGTIELLLPAPAGGVVVTLSSSNPNIVTLPATITIPAFAFTGTFTITTVEVATSEMVTISATLGTRTKTLQLAVHDPNVQTNKGWRAATGHYANIGDQVYVWPHIESVEHIVIEWQGVKTHYDPLDPIDFDRDVMAVIELYASAQAALREECDTNRYTALWVAWNNEMAKLTWWYRTKYLLPQAAWRASGCDACMITESATAAGGGGVTPPPTNGGPPTIFDIFLGNAGGEEPPPDSYTPEFIIALNNTFGNPSVRSTLPGEYEISAPVDFQNEFQLVCIPLNVWSGPVTWRASGFPLNMFELTDRPVINDHPYRVFRTTSRSAGGFIKQFGNAINISL